MSNVLLYTLLMAGIAFAISFFVAFVIKSVFKSIQRISIVQTDDYKRDLERAKRIYRIRKKNIISMSRSWKMKDSNEILRHYYGNNIPINKEASIIDTNEIVEYYYGKS